MNGGNSAKDPKEKKKEKNDRIRYMQYVEQNQLSTFGSERNDLNIVLAPLNPVISWSQETILKNDRVLCCLLVAFSNL